MVKRVTAYLLGRKRSIDINKAFSRKRTINVTIENSWSEYILTGGRI